MYNFIKQPDRNSCGPVALYNLLIWSYQGSIKPNLRSLIKSCKCGPPHGTYFAEFNQSLMILLDTNSNVVLDQIIFPVVYEQVCEKLAANMCMILLFHWEDPKNNTRNPDETNEIEMGEHYVLVTCVDKNRFCLINSDNPEKKYPIIEWITNKEMKKFLEPYQYFPGTKYQNASDCIYPKAWFFRKK